MSDNFSGWHNMQPPKEAIGEVYPKDAIDYSPLGRLEPLITPKEVISRFLFGIPLVSATRDPVTGKYAYMDDETLKDYIDSAVADVEEEVGVDIYPVKRREKHPFDINLYNSFGHLVVERAPILRVEKLSVTPSNGQDIFILPLEWLENAHFAKGQISIVPMTIASIGGAIMSPVQHAGASGGAAFINILGMKGWIPAFWQVEYVAGFPEGKIPRLVNDLIGINAAIMALGTLAATNRQGSYSLSIDGMGQSGSTPGPQVYDSRIQMLREQHHKMVSKLKARFGRKMFVGTI